MLSSKDTSPKRIVSLAISSILLLLFFSQFVCATEGNLSISGTKFLDLNSNNVKDKSDPALPGYIIYIDNNSDGELDPRESYVITDENGGYTFTNLSKGTYAIREFISNKSIFQPSSPQRANQFVNLTGESKKGVDFGNSMPDAAKASGNPQTSNDVPPWFFWVTAIGLIIIGILALLGAYLERKNSNEKKTNIQFLMASGFILLFLGFYLVISLLQFSKSMMGGDIFTMGSSSAIVTPVILSLLVLGAVLLMLWAQNSFKSENETGGMRKTIAGLLVIGLIAAVLFSLNGKIQNENIMTQFIQLVGIVVAFYFGSKATSDAYKGSGESDEGDEGDAEKDLDIDEDIVYGQDGTISMTISNKNKINFRLKKISIEADGKEVFAYTYLGPGKLVSEIDKSYPTGPLSNEKPKAGMDAAAKDKDKVYTIKIDTSMKKPQKSVEKTIKKEN
jgi:hypothetical protein